ncbi:MAG: hypothetical protein ACPG4U_08360 [Pseudomonadales bacterium]
MTGTQFTALAPEDPQMQRAFAQTAETIGDFAAAVALGGCENYLAKLRFRDPDLSEQRGED